MSSAEITYNELLASPDEVRAVRRLSDFDLLAVRQWMAAAKLTSWIAERLQGLCMVEGSRRFEAMVERELRGFGDIGHGSEVGL